MRIIVPHELVPSHDAVMVSNMIGYGVLLLVAILIWLTGRKSASPEPMLFLKLLVYLVLSVFAFRFNGFALPLGLLIAYLMMRRTKLNRPVKQTAVLFGGMLFLFSLFPLADRIDQLMDPPDQISTYIDRGINPTKQGFNVTVLDNENKLWATLVERDKGVVQLYKELADSRSVETVPVSWEPYYTIELRQDHKQERFRELQLQFDREGRFFTLYNGSTTYSFESTAAFREIFVQQIVPLVRNGEA
ncbi:hypothetical protein [Paenibacillus albus]|uniref:Uncharacterized protein n=1 Tax=Paenibacillus albus TaxID=2495582 RepID=A0A3Q8X6D4_9BACL|nr:hypothetical protein [Paenibacillus albus]AZN39886.1 hypothetical protein EJC50_09680 [Paenibacillus albus]